MNDDDLYSIQVSVVAPARQDKSGHVTIRVLGPSVDWDWEHGEATARTELVAACRYLSPIFAGLVVRAKPWMDYEQQEHGCGRTAMARLEFDEDEGFPTRGPEAACGLSYYGIFATPTERDFETPRAWFTVPQNAKDEWLERVDSWLRELVQW